MSTRQFTTRVSGRRICKNMVELVGAAFRREERRLLLGEEAHPEVTRSSLGPNLAQAAVPTGEPWDVVHTHGAVQVTALEKRCLRLHRVPRKQSSDDTRDRSNSAKERYAVDLRESAC